MAAPITARMTIKIVLLLPDPLLLSGPAESVAVGERLAAGVPDTSAGCEADPEGFRLVSAVVCSPVGKLLVWLDSVVTAVVAAVESVVSELSVLAEVGVGDDDGVGDGFGVGDGDGVGVGDGAGVVDGLMMIVGCGIRKRSVLK